MYEFARVSPRYARCACDCHKISCECAVIAAGTGGPGKLGRLAHLAAGQSIQLQEPTLGSWSTTEDGGVGADLGTEPGNSQYLTAEADV